MRFKRWPRPEPYRDTSRKRLAFDRKQRLNREALPLFASEIAAVQHEPRRKCPAARYAGTDATCGESFSL